MNVSLKSHYRLKAPCSNCPARKVGAIELRPGRVRSILRGLIEDDNSTFHCHKTVHSKTGGSWTESGEYEPSGQEAMCAGMAAVLMKAGLPTVGMRLAIAIGIAPGERWSAMADQVLDPQEILGAKGD